jgi:hypothetical protein
MDEQHFWWIDHALHTLCHERLVRHADGKYPDLWSRHWGYYGAEHHIKDLYTSREEALPHYLEHLNATIVAITEEVQAVTAELALAEPA